MSIRKARETIAKLTFSLKDGGTQNWLILPITRPDNENATIFYLIAGTHPKNSVEINH